MINPPFFFNRLNNSGLLSLMARFPPKAKDPVKADTFDQKLRPSILL
jgi:hypothetical protein